jgi:hypothetical protein
MSTFKRLFRHLCTTTAAGKRVFPPATLRAIEEAIRAGEQRHRAEVRLIIEPGLDTQAVLNGLTPRHRARELFAHYRVWDTEENCGVLVYINLADRQVEIVADRGVGRVISATQWQDICRTLTRGFAHGQVHESVLTALHQLTELLAQYYPNDGSKHNQLSDAPLIL